MLCEPSQLVRYGSAMPPLSYAVDNGAWGCFQREVPFDSEAFEKMLRLIGKEADWVVVPDIVQGGIESLEFSLSWLPKILPFGQCLVAVQDGMEPADVSDIINRQVGIFLGGSTDWKLETMRLWGSLARSKGAYFHVARVNTAKRIRLCQDAGAHSFDGTSVTRFSSTLPKLDNERRQGHLFPGMGK
jgi:hypothetical protein